MLSNGKVRRCRFDQEKYGVHRIHALQLVGPLSDTEAFAEADWRMLYSMESEVYATKRVTVIDGLHLKGLSPDEDTSSYRSDLVMRVASLLRKHPKRNRLSELPALSDKYRFAFIPTDAPS